MVRQSCTSSQAKNTSAKLSPLYTGPAKICKRLGLSTYLVQMSQRSRRYKVHNIINLQPYNKRHLREDGGMKQIEYNKKEKIKLIRKEATLD